ncbi:putative Mg2+ transporter-C (MgtC) family protein [Sediminibacillus halophilus]|uniref:Putative Mg2+ transporter-C (MgtC) family protein n=2 Tax=Sediminibacillus halophilus TaxID=482461 RepID=A0A1G9YUG6_9BACI|nr:putative Mg2+ transporter-C (MgtC) family protein [Sediminibacillus halophilus]
MQLSSLIHEDFTLMVIRLFVALLLSGLIGFEREWNNHAAGFRTHILVGVGSCLMMLLSIYGFEAFMEKYDNVRFDPARIPSYVISGIGFLGAGTIMVHGINIRGLTTAASIWAVAGLGLVVGAGMYSLAAVATLIILLSLVFLQQVERLFLNKRANLHFELIVEEGLKIESLLRIFEKYQSKIEKMEVERAEDDARSLFIELDNKTQIDKYQLIEEMSSLEHLKRVKEI